MKKNREIIFYFLIEIVFIGSLDVQDQIIQKVLQSQLLHTIITHSNTSNNNNNKNNNNKNNNNSNNYNKNNKLSKTLSDFNQKEASFFFLLFS